MSDDVKRLDDDVEFVEEPVEAVTDPDPVDEGAVQYSYPKTEQVLDLLADERDRQKELGKDGLVEDPIGLISVATGYLGLAVAVDRGRKVGTVKENLVKAAAVLVDAIERCD